MKWKHGVSVEFVHLLLIPADSDQVKMTFFGMCLGLTLTCDMYMKRVTGLLSNCPEEQCVNNIILLNVSDLNGRNVHHS